jgi:hypothetical protein
MRSTSFLDDLFRDLRGTRRHRLVVIRLDRIVLVVIIADELRVQGWLSFEPSR